MKITTYRQILRELPAKLRGLYSKTSVAAADALEKLDLEACTKEDVEAVLKTHEVHTSWALRPYCSCCDSETDGVAEVDEDFFRSTTICLSCAREAVQKLEAAK